MPVPKTNDAFYIMRVDIKLKVDDIEYLAQISDGTLYIWKGLEKFHTEAMPCLEPNLNVLGNRLVKAIKEINYDKQRKV